MLGSCSIAANTRTLLLAVMLFLVGCMDKSDPLINRLGLRITPHHEKDRVDCSAVPCGKYLGTFKRTYYILAWEAEYDAYPQELSAFDKNSRPVGERRFADEFLSDICLQGSGMLATGEVITLEWDRCGMRTTSAGLPGSLRRCNARCFSLLDPVEFPFGKARIGRSPVPFRTLAVDRSIIPLGTKIYLPAWDGLVLPNGQVHDGCFIAEDTGGAIIGKHIDLHAGIGRNIYDLVRRSLRSSSEPLYIDSPKCKDSSLAALYDPQEFLVDSEYGAMLAEDESANDLPDNTCTGHLPSDRGGGEVLWTCDQPESPFCGPEELPFSCSKIPLPPGGEDIDPLPSLCLAAAGLMYDGPWKTLDRECSQPSTPQIQAGAPENCASLSGQGPADLLSLLVPFVAALRCMMFPGG